MSPVTVRAAVRAFLRGKNVEYLDTSPPGLALERIIEMFKGLWACTPFQNAAIRELLEELASGGSRVATEVRGAIHRSLSGLSVLGQPATKEQLAQRVLTAGERREGYILNFVFEQRRRFRFLDDEAVRPDRTLAKACALQGF